MNSTRGIFGSGLALIVGGSLLSVESGPEILPVAQIESGMRGEWRTVVEGTTVVGFDLEVLGVAENFAGPQRSIIICQAIDLESKLTGPVAGMSGSPVYIDGKLVGAYAYGFDWQKEQTIIGVTPIEQMLELLRKYPLEVPSPGRIPGAPQRWDLDPGAGTSASIWDVTDSWSVMRENGRFDADQIGSLLRPLPAPLVASGFSMRSLRAFEPYFQKYGLSVVQAPSGSAAPGKNYSLKPGAPVAAVLLSGDFNIAVTGTVTYREGDTILAFGHPFFQMGPTRLPLAGAEIIAIVQSMRMSFKLSNIGPLVGSIYQDRLTGIAGRVGLLPSLTRLSIATRASNGVEQEFAGELFEHPSLSPLFAAIALLESLFSTLESSEKQTFYLTGRLDLEEHSSIEFSDVASGPTGAVDIAVEFMENYLRLVNNPFEMPHVEAIDIDIETSDEWLVSSLKSVQVESKRVRAGETVRLVLTLYNYHREPERMKLSIPVPRGLPSGQDLTILVADAPEIERLEGVRSDLVTSIKDIADQWRQSNSRRYVYVRLIQAAPGLRLDGENLPNLPPSVRTLYTSPGNYVARETIDEIKLWGTRLPVAGEFRGNIRVPVRLE